MPVTPRYLVVLPGLADRMSKSYRQWGLTMHHRAKSKRKDSGSYTFTLPAAIARNILMRPIETFYFTDLGNGAVLMSLSSPELDATIEAAEQSYAAYRRDLQLLRAGA